MKKDITTLAIKEFNYELPPSQIAEYPLAERDASRLLIYKEGVISEDVFRNLGQHLQPNTTLVVNNTRVIEARLLFYKNSGGVIELFCLEPLNKRGGISEAMMVEGKAEWKCLIGGASKWKPGQILSKEILIGNEHLKLEARYLGKEQDAFAIEFSWQPSHFSFAEVLHSFGSIPLPPYIKRKAEQADTERYQTIFSKHEGSVAAPTAALHFTDQVFEDLKQKDIKPSYVTLHVGAGTFKPVKTETIEEHQMHAEQFVITKNTLQELIRANEIIAVGTTSLRTLESLYWMGIKLSNKQTDFTLLGQWEAYELEEDITYKESLQSLLNCLDIEDKDELLCETSLLIRPGYTFHSAKGLITNFHQPQSTLLLLVSAFTGDDWKKVYRYGLTNNFRFLSYGDSSLLWRKD